MKRLALAALATLVLTYSVAAQTPQPAAKDQAIAPSQQLIARSPVHLSKALTASQKIRPKRVSRKGLSNVSDLKKDNAGIWRGRAQKDGKTVSVSLDFKATFSQTKNRRSGVMPTISRLFDDYSSAKQALRALVANGSPEFDISIVANNSDNFYNDRSNLVDRLDNDGAFDDRAEGAGTGGGVGAVAGGALGLLTGPWYHGYTGRGTRGGCGLGLLLQRLGVPCLAERRVLSLGRLSESGVPEEDAHVYAEGLRRGGVLDSPYRFSDHHKHREYSRPVRSNTRDRRGLPQDGMDKLRRGVQALHRRPDQSGTGFA